MMAENHLVVVLPVQQILRRTESIPMEFDGVQCTTSATSSASAAWFAILPQFGDEWKSIACSRFLLNMYKGHQLQPRCHTGIPQVDTV